MSAKKEYSNGEVTIVWKPELCIHSANCVKGLPGVFDTKKRPWINAEGATTGEIINQVKKCPSGALATYMNEKGSSQSEWKQVKISVAKDGPILINGPVHIENDKGEKFETGQSYALCRCGGSKNKPFCDGSHITIGFKG